LLKTEDIQEFINPNQQIIVGFSGGIDSTALLHLCFELFEQKKISNLSAVHVNHNLSVHSDVWAKHCQVLCKDLKIPLKTFSVNIDKNKSSLESQSRQQRFNCYKQILKPDGQLLLAHHCDDVAETIFLRLFRGTGIDGLQGLKTYRKFFHAQIIRPLLSFNKKDCLNYVKKNKLKFIEDDSNNNNSFDRNFLRNIIFPEINNRWKQPSKRIFAMTEKTQKKINALDYFLQESFAEEVENGALVREKFKNIPIYVIEEVIRFILRKKSIAAPNENVLAEVIKTFFIQKPTQKSLVKWSRKDGDQRGGKVWFEQDQVFINYLES